MSIAENLKRLRTGKGLSQRALAEKAGVGQQLISQIENGVNATTKKLPQIASALGCEVFDIDPNYSPGGQALPIDAQDAPLMRKFKAILDENDGAQLHLLNEYLDYLLSRNERKNSNSQ